MKWEFIKHGKRGMGLSVANYPKSRRVGVRVGRRELACIIWKRGWGAQVERVPVLWFVPGAAGWKARVQ